MIINATKLKVKINDVKRFQRDNVPLMSKVVQFNPRIKNTTLKYIEYKVITYDIFLKIKGKNIFKYNTNRWKITMLVNTHTGFSKYISEIPDTYKLNISKNNIKTSEIDEVHILENIKNEIVKVIKDNVINSKCHIHDIKVLDIKSIYKPYWVGMYNGKSVLLEA